MTAAIQTFRLQQEILRIVRLAGPSTTRALCAVSTRWSLDLGYAKLQRLLTAMRKANALMVYPIGRSEVLWAVPGQAKPAVAPRVERRRTPRDTAPAPPLESWWVTPDRDAFMVAAGKRWAES